MTNLTYTSSKGDRNKLRRRRIKERRKNTNYLHSIELNLVYGLKIVILICTFANNFETMQPRFRILHCFEYGKYGMTPTIDLADDVLHAYAIINSSIILLLTSLHELAKAGRGRGN